MNDKNEAIHDKLIGDLSTGFFGDSRSVYGNLERWRIYYAKHCPLPADEGKTVFEDLRTLQKKKLIKVGEYDVLLDIFQKVDISAIPIIKSARDSIQQNRETGRNEQRETKPDRNPRIAEITVKAYNREKEMHEDIGEILNHLVNDPKSALSPSVRKNENRPFSEKKLESLLKNFVEKNGQSREMLTCILEESRGLLTTMKTCHRVESCQIYSEGDCLVILLGFPTKEDKMRACKDEEKKLKKKIKSTFKIFFTVANMKRPIVEVNIMD